jgi:hypothetical protein
LSAKGLDLPFKRKACKEVLPFILFLVHNELLWTRKSYRIESFAASTDRLQHFKGCESVSTSLRQKQILKFRVSKEYFLIILDISQKKLHCLYGNVLDLDAWAPCSSLKGKFIGKGIFVSISVTER